jgi:hypothetical protein
MNRRTFIVLALLAGAILLAGGILPASANPPSQAVYFTPTPRPDGRIIYIVKQGDTCISISLLNRISEAELRSLNNIRGTDCVIRLGQELLLGMSGPAETPTIGPSPTATPLLPTPTAFAGNGEVCIVLFNDVNGNSMREEIEPSIAGGAVSLTDRGGRISRTGNTVVVVDPDTQKPLCFGELPEGDYNISLAVPQGYNATTTTNYPLKVKAGETATLDFGAQVSLRAATPAPAEGGPSPLLGILGGLMILAGAGLAIILRRSAR